MEYDIDDTHSVDQRPESQSFGEWLKSEMDGAGISIANLAEKSGITYVGIWNIVKGNTISPQKETRKKLAEALKASIPTEVEVNTEREEFDIAGYEWVDFTPSDLETVPARSGVYVFYDITDRPVYVGKSGSDVRSRVKDHQTRFWFKHPLVVRGAFIAISDGEMCKKIEMILIKFLGKHALLNSKGTVRDIEN